MGLEVVKLLAVDRDGTEHLVRVDANGRLAMHPAGELDVLAGEVFSAGDAVGLGAGEQGSIVLDNPASSGKTLVVRIIDCFTEVNSSLSVDFIEDPTVSGGTVLTPVNHHLGDATASVATVTIGQGITSGGTELDINGRVVRDAPYRLTDPVFIVPEGKSIAIRISAPGGLTGGAIFEPNVSWREI